MSHHVGHIMEKRPLTDLLPLLYRVTSDFWYKNHADKKNWKTENYYSVSVTSPDAEVHILIACWYQYQARGFRGLNILS